MDTIFKFDNLASTNTFLKQNIANYSDNAVIWSNAQTGGRGRMERTWHSVAGKDLTFSLKVSLENLPVDRWPCMTLAAGVAVAQVLRQRGVAANIKWPNDILITNKKVSGILCETVTGEGSWGVIGVGVNVNSTASDLAIVDKPATSLLVETGGECDRRDLLDALTQGIIAEIDILERSGFAPIHARLVSLLAWTDRPVWYAQHDGTVRTGRITRVAPDGALVICRDDDETVMMNAGELLFSEPPLAPSVAPTCSSLPQSLENTTS